MALWSYEQGYGSVVLQSGELTSEEHTQQVERIVMELNRATQGKLGITLCLGEQTAETYQRWKQAGAHRYLLRMETSNPTLYARLHPADHSFAARMRCLTMLKQTGYQVGSGVMIGLPGQTLDDLANDILFFTDFDLDMIGMGPYIPHTDTPLGNGLSVDDAFRKRQLSLGLKMIAVTRLQLHDVNIAATTALQALDDEGREKGLLAGANVIMPNVTDVQYRANYQLYANKPCLDENAAKCRNCLQWRVQSIGEEITWGERGDPLHFTKKGLPTCS
jgi:biotin synthase